MVLSVVYIRRRREQGGALFFFLQAFTDARMQAAAVFQLSCNNTAAANERGRCQVEFG